MLMLRIQQKVEKLRLITTTTGGDV